MGAPRDCPVGGRGRVRCHGSSLIIAGGLAGVGGISGEGIGPGFGQEIADGVRRWPHGRGAGRPAVSLPRCSPVGAQPGRLCAHRTASRSSCDRTSCTLLPKAGVICAADRHRKPVPLPGASSKEEMRIKTLTPRIWANVRKKPGKVKKDSPQSDRSSAAGGINPHAGERAAIFNLAAKGTDSPEPAHPWRKR